MKQINLEGVFDEINDVRLSKQEVIEILRGYFNQVIDLCAELVDDRLQNESEIRAFLIDGSSILKIKEQII